MPGRRNLTHERLRLEAVRPILFREHLERLREHLPDRELLLIGWRAILGHLTRLGVARPGLEPVTVRPRGLAGPEG